MKKYISNFIKVLLVILAKFLLKVKSPKVIVIIGSVGKTSTKHAIFTMLSQSFSIKMSSDTASTNLSAIYALLGKYSGTNSIKDMFYALFAGFDVLFFHGEYPEYIAIELSGKRKGEIKKIAKWLKPYMVVITRFPDVPAHVEYFKNVEEIMNEKTSIAKAIRKDGVLILNADDENVIAQKEILKSKTFTYGFSDISDIRSSDIQIISPSTDTVGGITFKINFDEKSFPVFLPNIYSKEYVSIALAALTASYSLGANMVDAISKLNDYITPTGRARVHFLDKGIVVIDDSYDSSPVACESALCMLGDIPFGKRKIAVLGDMLGLGRHTESSHLHIGEIAKDNTNILVTVGLRAKKIAEGARTSKMNAKKIFETETIIDVIDILQKNKKSGDVILLKGAHSLEMGEILEVLKK